MAVDFSPSSNFQQWITKLRVSWMGQKAQAIMGAFAKVAGDLTYDWMIRCVLETMPEYASSASVALIASERQLDQGAGEAISSFATRLTQAAILWRYGGTPLGLLLALHFAGFDNAVIVQQNGYAFQLQLPVPPILSNATTPWNPQQSLIVTNLMVLPTPSTPVLPATKTIPTGTQWWTTDSQTDFCSRFKVLFPTPTPWAGGTPSASQLSAIKSAITKWKPQKATCLSIIVQQTGLLWGWPPTQVWGAATGNWGGTSTVFSYP